MSDYSVVVAPTAAERIESYGRFIAERSGSVEVAEHWINRVYDAIGTLAIFPRRFALAEEGAHRSYEIRRMLIGSYLALYTIDDRAQAVKLIAFRHAARLPRPEELPKEP